LSFQELVNHNPDIERLLKKGYALAVDSAHLIVRDIPYLDAQGVLQWGAIVTNFKAIDQHKVTLVDHQIYWAGSDPHNLDFSKVANLAGGPMQLTLGDASADVSVQRSCSNKDPGRAPPGFDDFFEKIEHYVGLFAGPAVARYPGTNYLTFRSVETIPNSAFKYYDTLTSRAQVGDLAARFADEVVAIIGLGGTGSYLLDLLTKTPVREIRAFDRDVFHVHNAFRSPGRVEDQEFDKNKAEVYRGRYENFRHGLNLVPKFISADSGEDFAGVTFAFVSVDKGSSRSMIFNLLIGLGIPFIDVGMGLDRKRGSLSGMLRTTYYPPDRAQQLRSMQLAEMIDEPDDAYRSNIQTGELNALNACLAIIKYKQLKGFYIDDSAYVHTLFDISDSCLVGDGFQ
jgi:hypothetical protein